MKENEWIDENLKRIINSNGNNVEYINRNGLPANYEDERDDVIETLERLNLAKCDNFGGVLMRIGEIVRDEYDGNYLKYLEWKEVQKEIQEGVKRKKIRNKKIKKLIYHAIVILGTLGGLWLAALKTIDWFSNQDKIETIETLTTEEEIITQSQDSTATDSTKTVSY